MHTMYIMEYTASRTNINIDHSLSYQQCVIIHFWYNLSHMCICEVTHCSILAIDANNMVKWAQSQN